jgi:K+-transporting ATPase ATPase B chain
MKAMAMLRRNLAIFGFGGLVFPFIGIKLIDILVNLFHLA